MKVAINTRFLLKNKLEGIGRVTFEIVKRIVQSHPEDEFIFLFDRPYDKAFIFAENIKPIILKPPARHPFLWYWWFEQSLPAALRQHRADVFFSPDNHLSLKAKTKTVMITHDLAHIHYPNEIPFLAKKFYDYYVPKYVQKADHIIAVSEFTKKDIIKQYQTEEQKISVVYNACTDNFKPIDVSVKNNIKKKYAEGQDYFFYIGSINPRKNIINLIHAFELFKMKTKSSNKLLLGGRFAWQSGPIKNAFDQSKFQSDIKLLGYLEEEELPKIIAAAKALVYVSLFEGFGLPILEAFHCETPVITSNVTSMPEVAGEAALMVNPKSVVEIAKAMEATADQTRSQQFVEKGKAQREKFSWDDSAKKVYAILKEVAKK